jgi:hypothetical protein
MQSTESAPILLFRRGDQLLKQICYPCLNNFYVYQIIMPDVDQSHRLYPDTSFSNEGRVK